MPDVIVTAGGVEVPRGPAHLGQPNQQIITLFCSAGPATLKQSRRGVSQSDLFTMQTGEFKNIYSTEAGDWIHALSGTVMMLTGTDPDAEPPGPTPSLNYQLRGGDTGTATLILANCVIDESQDNRITYQLRLDAFDTNFYVMLKELTPVNERIMSRVRSTGLGSDPGRMEFHRTGQYEISTIDVSSYVGNSQFIDVEEIWTAATKTLQVNTTAGNWTHVYTGTPGISASLRIHQQVTGVLRDLRIYGPGDVLQSYWPIDDNVADAGVIKDWGPAACDGTLQLGTAGLWFARPAAPKQLGLSPATATVDVNNPQVYTCEVQDSTGQKVPGDTTAVTFSSNLAGTWSPSATVNAVDGVATATFTPTVDGAHTITATSTGLTQDTAALTVNAAVTYELRFAGDTTISIPSAVVIDADANYKIQLEFKRTLTTGRRDIWSSNAGTNYLQTRLAEPGDQMRSQRSTGGSNQPTLLWTQDTWHQWEERWDTSNDWLYFTLDAQTSDNQFNGATGWTGFTIGGGGAGSDWVGYIRNFKILDATDTVIHHWAIDDNSTTIVDQVGGATYNGTLTIGSGAWEVAP